MGALLSGTEPHTVVHNVVGGGMTSRVLVGLVESGKTVDLWADTQSK